MCEMAATRVLCQQSCMCLKTTTRSSSLVYLKSIFRRFGGTSFASPSGSDQLVALAADVNENRVSVCPWPSGRYLDCRQRLGVRRFSSSRRIQERAGTWQPHPNTTLDEEEVEKFRALSQQFWQEDGDFQALHAMNDLRVPLIRDVLAKQGTDVSSNTKPLNGKTIVDVGCGGGILSEPLARLGATVIGIDATPENIEVAQHHLSHDPAIRHKVKYICGTAEDLMATEDEVFDAVVASEVMEHVTNKREFIRTCVKLVKPGGSIFFTTVNKTWRSYLLGICMAEKVLGLVPDGTHDWNKFVGPEFVQETLEENDCIVRLTHGMMYNPVTRRWSWMEDTNVNYAISARKRDTPTRQEHASSSSSSESDSD